MYNVENGKPVPYTIDPKIPFTTLTIATDLIMGGEAKLHFGDAYLRYDSVNNAVCVENANGDPINFYVTGGISMYGLGNTSVTSVMDAIINNLDPNTLEVKDGLLTVVGGTGGGTADAVAWGNITDKPSWIGSTKPSYNIGELSNVGTWANSVADVDRIMYQAAGSSMWVAKSLSDLAVGGVSGDYLPLSGGTLANTGHVLIINRLDDSTPWVTFQKQGTELGRFGIDANNPLWYNTLNNTAYSLLHSGNYSNYALPLTGGTMKGQITFPLKTYILTGSGDAIYGHDSDGILVGHSTLPLVLRSNGTTTINGNPILHSGNYSSYALPLSGGTLNNAINFSNNFSLINAKYDNTNYSNILYVDSYTNAVIFGSPYWSKVVLETSSSQAYRLTSGNLYKIWDEGNDGSGSGLDADLLDGVQLNGIASYIMGNNDYKRLSAGTNLNNVGAGFWGTIDNTAYGNAPYQNFGLICMNLNYGYAGQLVLPYDCENYRIAYRDTYYSSGNILWTNWKYVAFTDSNVASATKLQTARTIWGQSFDGTGNVSGTITVNVSSGSSSTVFQAHRTNATNDDFGVDINLLAYQNKGLIIGGGGYGGIFGYYNGSTLNEILRLSYSGNVGIGTTSPAYKLDVSGSIRSTANLFTAGHVTCGAGSEGIYITGSAINWHNSSNAWAKSIMSFSSNGLVTVHNNLLVSGGITMYSDQRKKTILNNVELSLKQIANAPLVEHFYNSDDKRTTHVGSIAQYWAGINDWFCKLDNEGYYTMEIQNCALASAISIARELSRYESKTDKTIKQLKKRICQLEEEIERLKSA